MGNIFKCPHCGKPIIIEPQLKIDVSVQKLDLEEKTHGHGDGNADKKSGSH